MRCARCGHETTHDAEGCMEWSIDRGRCDCPGLDPAIPASEVEALRDELEQAASFNPDDSEEEGWKRATTSAVEALDALLARHGAGR